MSKVVKLEDRRDDLHLSEWCGFVRGEAIDLECLALKLERETTMPNKIAVIECVDRMEELLIRARRVANRTV